MALINGGSYKGVFNENNTIVSTTCVLSKCVCIKEMMHTKKETIRMVQHTKNWFFRVCRGMGGYSGQKTEILCKLSNIS